MSYNRVGDFSLAREDLWTPEDGDLEQEPIEEWVKVPTKLRLLVLAAPAGTVWTDMVEALQEHMPAYEWRPLAEVTAQMDDEEVRSALAGSQPKPSAVHRLIPPPKKKGKAPLHGAPHPPQHCTARGSADSGLSLSRLTTERGQARCFRSAGVPKTKANSRVARRSDK